MLGLLVTLCVLVKVIVASSGNSVSTASNKSDDGITEEYPDREQMCPAPPPVTGVCDGTGPTCMRSCDGVAPGDYQSCNSCNTFVTCWWGWMTERACTSRELVWNDLAKDCMETSPTCQQCYIPKMPKWMEFDFRAGTIGEETDALKWLVKPPEVQSSACANAGLMRISPPTWCSEVVVFQLNITSYRDFNFHIAGTPNNDAFANHIFGQTFGANDAELHNFGEDLFAYSSSGSGLRSWSTVMPQPNGHITICLKFTKDAIDMVLGGRSVRLTSTGLFSEITPLYFGVNRVISQKRIHVDGAFGAGLCAGRVSFDC